MMTDTSCVEAALLDYQRMTQELPTFQPSLFVQGATVEGSHRPRNWRRMTRRFRTNHSAPDHVNFHC